MNALKKCIQFFLILSLLRFKTMIIAKNIHKYYGEVEVLKGVNFHIKKR